MDLRNVTHKPDATKQRTSQHSRPFQPSVHHHQAHPTCIGPILRQGTETGSSLGSLECDLQ